MKACLEEIAARLRRLKGPDEDGDAEIFRIANDLRAEAERVAEREARLRETVHEQTRAIEGKILELSIVKRIADLVAGSLRRGDLLERVLGVLLGELRLENGSIFLLDRRSGDLRLEAGAGRTERKSDSPSAELRIGEGIAGWVAASREALLVPDVSRDVRFQRTAGQPEARGSLVCVPLLAKDRVLGVLNLSTPEVSGIESDSVRILRIAGGLIAGALEGIDLHRELRDLSGRLEETVESRTAELSRRSEDLRRKNDQITELYFSLELAQRELEDRNRDLVQALTFNDNIVETVGVGIGVVARSGRVLTWNRAMGEITDGLLEKESVLGRRLDEIPEKLRAEFALDRPLSDAFESGNPARLRDHRVELPSRRVLHLNVTHLPVSIADSEHDALITVIENVTDNVELHEQQVKSERLGAITATMVSVNHEVNNPLAVILGHAQMMIRILDGVDGPDAETMRRKLAKIEEEALRIREITRKLATLAEPVLVPYPSSEGGVHMVDVDQSR